MRIFPKDRDLNEAPAHVELDVRASDFGLRREEVHLRLDEVLCKHLSWRSRSSLQELIRAGHVAVDAADPAHANGRGAFEVETRPGRRLLDGSRVRVDVPEEIRAKIGAGASSELDVLYEDDWVIAVDKPAGVPVHPSGRHLADTMIQRVHARYGADNAGPGRVLKLCHRLDLETSGVLLVARERRAHAELMGQFESRRTEKEYLAIVAGAPEEDAGTIEFPIGPARASAVRLKMAVVADGQPARTDWRVLERASGCALLELRLHTGRQHQIRVHLAGIGHPIVGDKLYGPGEEYFLRAARGELTALDLEDLGLARHALHEHRLAFEHPATVERIEIASPLPDDLEAYLVAHREIPDAR
jgi:23S rRNA pseudouridine1911/1915/1917 synthase